MKNTIDYAYRLGINVDEALVIVRKLYEIEDLPITYFRSFTGRICIKAHILSYDKYYYLIRYAHKKGFI